MFYEQHIIHLERVMNRGSSIQVVYQLSILIHNYLNFPAIELVYQDETPGLPTAYWIIKLALLCISSFLSAYSTLSLPIQTAEMRSLKESCSYCTFRKNFCLLSKRIFNLLFHICSTYITVFLVMQSDRFVYFREFISGKTGEKNLEAYGFVIYGSIIFLVFPFLVLLENFLAVTILVAAESQKKVQKTLSGFGKTLRIRV